MKSIIFLLLLAFSLMSCNYQEAVTLQGGSAVSFLRAFSSEEVDEVVLSPDLVDADYFEVILSKIVVSVGLGSSYGESVFDTLVDYNEYYQLTKTGNAEVLNARKSLYKYFKVTNPDSFSSTNGKLAFYINAYNFFTLETVLLNFNEGRLKSITDIGGRGSFRAFTKIFHEVSGKKLSLDQIENEVVRPMVNFADGRIHFALICASIGCPILLEKAYREDQLDEQLDLATRKGLLLSRILSINGNSILLGQIFNWFADDFINDEGSVKAFLKKYLPANAPAFPANIDYIEYDWLLNASR